MRRRGFLSALAGIAVASAAQCFGAIETPKEAARKAIAIRNAYLNANYESVIYFHPSVMTVIDDSPMRVNAPKSGYAIPTGNRYDFVAGEWIILKSPDAIH